MTNFFIAYANLYILIFIIIMYVYLNLTSGAGTMNIDFFYAASQLFQFSLIFYLLKNLVTFFLTLELISCFILYKIVTSDFYLNFKNLYLLKFKQVNKKNILNTIIIQFWVNFFSSVFIFLYIILIHGMLGTSDFVTISLILTDCKSQAHIGNNFYILINLIFFFCFFFKLGAAPISSFKVELYKNLPMPILFFYTSFYFFNLIFFLSIFFIFYLSFIIKSIYVWVYFLIMSFIAYLFYIIFDTGFIKAFLSYSTLLNIFSAILLIFLSSI